MIKPGRIPCCIPFCRRTADADKYAPGTEIICQPHWRMVPTRLKRRYARVKRLGRMFHRRGRDTSRLCQMAVDIWNECKTAVLP